MATTLGGTLFTLNGSEQHPYSKGKLCARGHGFAQMAYNEERVTQPLRRTENGEFEPIDWDTAFREIGEKVQAIVAASGRWRSSTTRDRRASTTRSAS